MLFFSVLYTTEHDCHCYSRSSQSLDRKTCQPAKKKRLIGKTGLEILSTQYMTNLFT